MSTCKNYVEVKKETIPDILYLIKYLLEKYFVYFNVYCQIRLNEIHVQYIYEMILLMEIKNL